MLIGFQNERLLVAFNLIACQHLSQRGVPLDDARNPTVHVFGLETQGLSQSWEVKQHFHFPLFRSLLHESLPVTVSRKVFSR